MNDLARETLVAAALRGHKQVQGSYHNHDGGGECAMGVLHLALHKDDRYSAIRCESMCTTLTRARYDLTNGEEREIIYRNDELGQDFLTIARKVGAEGKVVTEEDDDT